MHPPDPRMGDIRRVRQNLIDRFGTAPPEIAVILGTGFGGATESAVDALKAPYPEVGLPPVGVALQKGELVVGQVAGRRVAFLSGRHHHYEGYDPATVVLGIRSMIAWGISGAILTACVGSLHRELRPGALVVVKDHINELGFNPLQGPNLNEFGTRFPDMSTAYTPFIRQRALALGREMGLDVHEGVYAAMPGPSYETPAEIRKLAILGGDVVGMSLVPEALVLGHAGVPLAAFAGVANLGAGLSDEPIAHHMIEQAMNRCRDDFARILVRLIETWA